MTPSRRAWLVAFLGFLLLTAGWAFATPYNGTPDEQDHILRAYGVAAGQVVVAPAAAVRGSGGFVTAPRSLVRENCWKHQPAVPAGCAPEPGGDATPVRAATGAARYHPFYYAAVGLPLVLSPDWTGVLVARLVSAALVAALLALAFIDAWRWTRSRLGLVGVVAATTPMAVHMGGAVNPSGPEIAAGIAFFAAAVPLLHRPDAARSRTLLWHAGVAALGLVLLRPAGPLWLVVCVVALLVPLRWAALRERWAWRPLRRWSVALVAAMAVSVAWTVALRTTDLGDFRHGRSWSALEAVRIEVDRLRLYADELVGVLSWLDTRLPGPAYLVWQFAVATLVIFGFVLARPAGRWRLATLAAAGIGVPMAMEILFVNRTGFITQGRYLLPVLVGLPILAGYLISDSDVSADQGRSLRRMFTALLPLHLVFLGYTMIRWQGGLLATVNPLRGSWHPPLGSAVPLLLAAAGVALLGWLMWSSGPSAPPRVPAPRTPDRAEFGMPPVRSPGYGP